MSSDSALDPRWTAFLAMHNKLYEQQHPEIRSELLDTSSPSFSFSAFDDRCSSLTKAGQSPCAANVTVRDIEDSKVVKLVRVYSPQWNEEGARVRVRPALIYMHGGGYCFLSCVSFEPTMRKICAAAQCVVITPEYTLAREQEETKFPTSVEECFGVFRWTIQTASDLGIDTTRIFIGGDSCGGGLTTAITLMAREKKLQIQPAGQILLSPFLIPECETPSYRKLGRGGFANPREIARFVWKVYQRKAKDINNPYFCPFKATTLKGLPRALVIVCEHDPIKDDGVIYAARLKEEGVDTVCVVYEDMPHCHFLYDLVFPLEAKMVINQIAGFINL